MVFLCILWTNCLAQATWRSQKSVTLHWHFQLRSKTFLFAHYWLTTLERFRNFSCLRAIQTYYWFIDRLKEGKERGPPGYFVQGQPSSQLRHCNSQWHSASQKQQQQKQQDTIHKTVWNCRMCRAHLIRPKYDSFVFITWQQTSTIRIPRTSRDCFAVKHTVSTFNTNTSYDR